MKAISKIWLDNGGKAFGRGPNRLLKEVEAANSLNKAAARLGMSYSKAWRLIRTMEIRLGVSLLERTVGGIDGGGSRVTPQAKELMHRYEEFTREAEQSIEEIYQKYFGLTLFLIFLTFLGGTGSAWARSPAELTVSTAISLKGAFTEVGALFRQQQAGREEITVSAAADLSNAFREIGGMYEKKTGVKVLLNFGSTGMLAQQIEGGAPVDLFAAANRSFIDDLEKKRLIFPETKGLYATGRITLAAPKEAAKLDSLKDLLRPEIKKVAIANPAHAPYGMAGKAALEKIGLWDKVSVKMVYGENVRQTLTYVETGSVDAAIVALSISIGSEANYILIPQELHPPLEQALAVIKGGKNQRRAREFAEFINGPKGRPIMNKYGFILPSEMK